MSYTVTRTNGLNPIVIPDGTINTETSVTLVGKNYPNYGAILDQNFLRILENSASVAAPSAPIVGELWYKSDDRVLKVYIGDGIWKNVGSTTTASKSTLPSGPTSHNIGDLWYETDEGKLYAFDGTTQAYKLIGPIGGAQGIVGETITDSIASDHDVISFYFDTDRYAIFSADAVFTPSPAISGFPTVSPGFNLATTAFFTDAKFVGQASDAVTLTGIGATQFIRNDINSSTTGTLSVVNNTGLYVGTSQNFHVSVAAPNVAIINETALGAMSFKVKPSSILPLRTAMDIYPNGNIVANYDLTVAGNISFANTSNDLVITGTSPSYNPSTGALRLSVGGLGVAGNINTGGSNNNFVGQVRASNFVSNSSITAATIGNAGAVLYGTLNSSSAAQTNITSVGTLTALTVTGLASLQGGIAGTLNTASQPNITALGTLTSLTSTGTVNFGGAGTVTLGSNSNVKITGGTSGQYMVTDGSGNISWSSITGSNNQVPYFQSGILAGSSSLTYNGTIFAVTGNITATGEITAFASDSRLKTNIQPLLGALDKVDALSGFTYNFNDLAATLGFSTTDRYVGVSAQEVQAVLPEAVKQAPANPDYLTVQYDKIVPLLIEAIKELRQEVKDLKASK